MAVSLKRVTVSGLKRLLSAPQVELPVDLFFVSTKCSAQVQAQPVRCHELQTFWQRSTPPDAAAAPLFLITEMQRESVFGVSLTIPDSAALHVTPMS